MSKPISDLQTLLAGMQPVLNEGVYAYSVVPSQFDVSELDVFAVMRETEGVTVITSEAEAIDAKLPILFRAAWITLEVHSDLQAVGLTAAVASALGEAGISCNVVAAAHHDHVFVPIEQACNAIERLQALQQSRF